MQKSINSMFGQFMNSQKGQKPEQTKPVRSLSDLLGTPAPRKSTASTSMRESPVAKSGQKLE